MNPDGSSDSKPPFWRRPRRLRRQLAGLQATTVLVAMLLVGGLNLVAAGRLLDRGSAEQLVQVAESRSASIELGIRGLLADVSATAADLAVVEALSKLDEAYGELDSVELAINEREALDRFYEDSVITPIEEAGLASLTMSDVAPQTAAGRYLQYHYLIKPLADQVEGSSVVDPGDGSDFSEIHSNAHPFLSNLLGPTVGDVLLISAESAQVVYSVNKSIDFGTSLRDGPQRNTALATAVLETLPSVRPGEAVLADYEIYIPSAGTPTLFVTAAVQDETEVIGALVFRVPIEALDAITTAGQRWDEVGLGKGESYVVGSDAVLRSASRRWIEDPEGYLGALNDDSLRNFIEVFDSPVGLQPVDTKPVRVVLDGGRFEGNANNYLGEPTLTFARELEIGGLRWVVVAERPRNDVRGPLLGYALRLAILVAVLLPASAICGFVLADRLARSIPLVVSMAEGIADGERGLSPPPLGKNEFGDLARRLAQMSTELGERESALEREFESRRELLLAVLPPRLVGEHDDPEHPGDTAGGRTVIAVAVEIDSERTDDQDAGATLSRFAAEADRVVGSFDVERVRAAAEQSLFVAGLESANDGAAAALEFATSLGLLARQVSIAGDSPIWLRIGIATGPVATGVLGAGTLTFNAWGEPVRRAHALAALSQSAEILVDESTILALPDGDWGLAPTKDLIALDGERMPVAELVLPDEGSEPNMDSAPS